MTLSHVLAKGWKVRRLNRGLWLCERHGAYLAAAPSLPDVLACLLFLTSLDALENTL